MKKNLMLIAAIGLSTSAMAERPSLDEISASLANKGSDVVKSEFKENKKGKRNKLDSVNLEGIASLSIEHDPILMAEASRLESEILEQQLVEQESVTTELRSAQTTQMMSINSPIPQCQNINQLWVINDLDADWVNGGTYASAEIDASTMLFGGNSLGFCPLAPWTAAKVRIKGNTVSKVSNNPDILVTARIDRTAFNVIGLEADDTAYGAGRNLKIGEICGAKSWHTVQLHNGQETTFYRQVG